MGTETSDKVVVREATEKDVPRIYDIGTRCFSDAWLEETVAGDLAKPHSTYWVAESNHKIVGYACFWFILDEAQLVNIGVDPEHRRRGVAERLLQKGIEEAVKREMKTLFLEVRMSNVGAQALYRKYGLQVVSVRKNVYTHSLEDGYIMSRAL